MAAKGQDACADAALVAAAEAFTKAHDPDPEHAFQVARTSLALFDALSALHKLGPRERLLLHVAALMHDTGYENQPLQHHKGSRDLILSANLQGLSAEERMMVACIARYHRGSAPDPSHKVYRDLSRKDQARVAQLAATLRIADGLDRSHEASTASVRVEFAGDTVRLLVRQREPNTTDIATAIKKAALFEKVFAVRVAIMAK